MNAPNPYAAPATDVNGSDHAVADELVPASRGARFSAALIDYALYLPGMALGATMGFFMGRGSAPPEGLAWIVRTTPAGPLGLVIGVGLMIAVWGFQAYLVASTGKSLGKRWIGTRIVRMDGSAAGFISGVLLRMIVPGLITPIPYAGKVFWLIDVLFVCRPDQRCLHDLIAGTRVVSVRRP
jgi:uncharacterized RDD family membrane protein YckC